jgi:TfoX/Sxy family transcriptional regulator of competence genes
MAYDPVLAERTRVQLARSEEFTERKMFGGLCFLVNGNMCCGVAGNDLVLRLSPEAAERALAKPHARPMDFTGRPMKSMVYVDPSGTQSDADLGRWVRAATEIAGKRPAKPAAESPRKRRA